LVLYVSGAVVNPGIVTLPVGGRVQDAITAAGGTLDEADLSRINLAAPAIDGSQITIPTTTSNSEPSPVSSSKPLININFANVDELAELPGVGPATAQRIVDYRTQFGLLSTLEDHTQVFGIGPATLEQIKNLITVDQ
jgi:competence protein ComEA